jgi:hypothetical protein
MKRDHVARRRVKSLDLPDNRTAALADFSVISLILEEPVLKKTCQSADKDDRAIKEKILKMGAALLTASGRHGAYNRVH